MKYKYFKRLRCGDSFFKIYMKLFLSSLIFSRKKYFTWVPWQFFSEFDFSISIMWKKTFLKNCGNLGPSHFWKLLLYIRFVKHSWKNKLPSHLFALAQLTADLHVSLRSDLCIDQILLSSQLSEKFNPTVAVSNLNFMPWGLNWENLFTGKIDKVLH